MALRLAADLWIIRSDDLRLLGLDFLAGSHPDAACSERAFGVGQ